jgi:uncharacterized RmlC-like cupin family protein
VHLRMLKKHGYDVAGLQAQLQAHPQVWNSFRIRTEPANSPHRETSDIFVRYNPRANYHGDRQAFNAKHEAEWWPVVETLTEAKRLAESVAAEVGAKSIGMVLLTRIPAGKQVYPHIDVGWHARHYEKFALQIHGNERQAFHFEGEQLVTQDGDLFWFENAFPHWVTNDSEADRVTMIVCLCR